jgi:hypothetical protein
MGFFANFCDNIFRKRIIQLQGSLIEHLESGGDILDNRSRRLLEDMTKVALRSPNIQKVFNFHQVSVDDLCVMMAAGVIALEPNPCSSVDGKKFLVPVYLLLEWKLLDNFFALLKNDLYGQTLKERRRIIAGCTAHSMEEVKAILDREAMSC